MAVYLKISEFARLARVSVKALHHYDEIGLFRPAHVDRFTGYRYYAIDQLPRLNRILALRDLGFSLAQIQQALDDDVSAQELRGMLRLRKAQLQSEIESAQAKLTQVEIRLCWIEQEGKMPNVEVLVKQETELWVAGAREVVVSPTMMRERCIALDAAACRQIHQMNLQTDGVSLALYYSGSDAGIDVEMAYRVVAPGRDHAAHGDSVVHRVPAALVAYTVYRGSYDDFAAVGQVHTAIRRWIEEGGYQIVGPSREYYLRPPQRSADPMGVMEIQYPVAAA
jgi:DNA-binding transcriptional MerR regulator